MVESRRGKVYPVETPYGYMNDGIYRYMVNSAHDDKTVWAWVEFGDDGPALEDWTPRRDGTGPPPKAPWEHP